ncbi:MULTISPECIES: acyl-CoA dehydrogenase family protein [Burkholderia cepacia complex]|uniref:acyl-CoA dehydrogenase family protein n=1 Tax=Burkholderia cepacia complex TaxID=87882 RepID=UPI000678BF61|nr:acyl-CoA dehydrogenase [Burkholderia cenocepacia]KWU23493.1 acyl-CoA dehydrogenase [Burkholderia cenocepacia]CAG2360922.1 acyl-CoA dehydrogenase [Burkholderia cenocepacia]CAG2360932.1 acyl-CoA dehydrogenase [Burkholderia cenocepacia]CAG2360955.1 acyl-CoA dehydrogenase [Burkholderia cenocepacia]CAG2360959.1 acyl-CoA dehydrogenase [Burkholderia cenocepacia]
MDFELSDEQRMLQESAQRFVQKSYTFEYRRHLATQGGGFSRKTWHTLAEMGWFGIAVPEEMGGLGFSPVESAIVAEQIGRALVLEPYVMCGVLPASIVMRCGREGQRETILGEIASGEAVYAVAHSERDARGQLHYVTATANQTSDGAWRLDGYKTLVVGAPVADRLLVVARTGGAVSDTGGIGVFLVDPEQSGVTLKTYELLDGTPSADLLLEGVMVAQSDVVGDAGRAFEGLQGAVDEAIVALCAELVGDMEDAIELASEYLKTRKQFGVAIGTFQALQHRMADMAIEAMQARATLHRALAALSEDSEKRSVEISGCKAQTTRSAKFVTQQGIQLHGGYGITNEYKVGHHYRRHLVLDTLFGNMDYHLNRYARQIQREALAAAA